MSLEPVPARERFISLDILRGIALLGVLIGNSASYSGRAFAGEPPNPTALDTVAKYIGDIFVESKAQTLLCMLFGFGFAMQLLRAERRGEPVMGVYIRRLLVLFAIGCAHVLLLWWGDVCGQANDKQAAMNNDLNTMSGAINAQFPDLRASISAVNAN
jgi:uncharacterized protein